MDLQLTQSPDLSAAFDAPWGGVLLEIGQSGTWQIG
jgi:hypothetical protein